MQHGDPPSTPKLIQIEFKLKGHLHEVWAVILLVLELTVFSMFKIVLQNDKYTYLQTVDIMVSVKIALLFA